MPRLYAAFLEDMAYARDKSMCFGNSAKPIPIRAPSVPPSRTSGRRSPPGRRPNATFSISRSSGAGRTCSRISPFSRKTNSRGEGTHREPEGQGTFSAPPDRINTTRVKLPDTTKDCHFVLVFELHDAVFSETALSRARLGLYAGRAGKRLDQPVLAELTVSANPYAGTLLSARGGQDGSLHQHLLPGRTSRSRTRARKASAARPPAPSGSISSALTERPPSTATGSPTAIFRSIERSTTSNSNGSSPGSPPGFPPSKPGPSNPKRPSKTHEETETRRPRTRMVRRKAL